ncbi:hypothetical protein Tco_0806241 [Tanacetum coccineum]
MEEYIRLQEEKALSQGETFNWQTAMYGKMEYCEDEDDCFTNFETKFPAIVLDNTLTSNATISCGPTVSPLNDNEIDFRISFDESDDEDYTVVYDKNSFSYKIISVNNLKTDSENDNDKVNMPSFPSPEPEVSYFNDLYFFKDFENEFPSIVYNDALMTVGLSPDVVLDCFIVGLKAEIQRELAFLKPPTLDTAPTVEQEDDTIRLKTYEELSDKQKLQADCDLKATNIVLKGLPPDVYSLFNHHKVAKSIGHRVKLLMQRHSIDQNKTYFEQVGLEVAKMKIRGDDDEVLTDKELSDLEETHVNEDDDDDELKDEVLMKKAKFEESRDPGSFNIDRVGMSNEKAIKDEREPMDEYGIGNLDDHLVSKIHVTILMWKRINKKKEDADC